MTAFNWHNGLTLEEAARIYARRIGLKPFLELYENSVVETKYMTGPYPYEDGHDNRNLNTMAGVLALHPGLDLTTDLIRPNLMPAHVEKDEFVSAIIRLWLGTEAHRLARTCRYAPRMETRMQEVLSKVEKVWKSHQYGEHFERMAQLEVYDFIYGFLLLKTSVCDWEGGNFLCWRPEYIDFMESMGLYVSTVTTPPENCLVSWQVIYERARDCLTPPDILELLMLSSHWKISALVSPNENVNWSGERCAHYMRLRGGFDNTSPDQGWLDAETTFGSSFTLQEYELGIFQTLKIESNWTPRMQRAMLRAWKSFGLLEWQKHFRGQFSLFSTFPHLDSTATKNMLLDHYRQKFDAEILSRDAGWDQVVPVPDTIYGPEEVDLDIWNLEDDSEETFEAPNRDNQYFPEWVDLWHVKLQSRNEWDETLETAIAAQRVSSLCIGASTIS